MIKINYNVVMNNTKSNQKYQVLLIDDDTVLTDLLTQYIEQYEFIVSVANDGESGLEKISIDNPDIIVLDIMMPKKDGLTTLKELRELSNIPVIMLTARGDDVDRIVGLELGADDYLGKPGNPRELVARLRALLRRGQIREPESSIEYADMLVIPGARKASLKNQPLNLTSTEFSLLQCLLENVGQVVNKSSLYEYALGREQGKYDRTVDMHISNLRRKLGEYDNGTVRFETIRGVGYQLNRQQ